MVSAGGITGLILGLVAAFVILLFWLFWEPEKSRQTRRRDVESVVPLGPVGHRGHGRNSGRRASHGRSPQNSSLRPIPGPAREEPQAELPEGTAMPEAHSSMFTEESPQSSTEFVLSNFSRGAHQASTTRTSSRTPRDMASRRNSKTQEIEEPRYPPPIFVRKSRRHDQPANSKACSDQIDTTPSPQHKPKKDSEAFESIRRPKATRTRRDFHTVSHEATPLPLMSGALDYQDFMARLYDAPERAKESDRHAQTAGLNKVLSRKSSMPRIPGAYMSSSDTL